MQPLLTPSDILGPDYDHSLLPSEYDDVITFVALVDAAMASRILERNVEPAPGHTGTNRRSNAARISALKELILDGEWRFTHQGVGIDRSGHLLDGAHRLKAIVAAAEEVPHVAIPLNITLNVPTGADRDIDTGRPRSLPDRLQMLGIGSSVVVAAVARLTMLFENQPEPTKPSPGWWVRERPQRVVLERYILEHREPLEEAARVGNRQKLFSPVALGAAHYLILGRLPEERATLDTFVELLYDGDGLTNGHPIFAVRRYAWNHRLDDSMPQSWIQLAFLLKAFRLFREGRTDVRLLSFKHDMEAFPQP